MLQTFYVQNIPVKTPIINLAILTLLNSQIETNLRLYNAVRYTSDKLTLKICLYSKILAQVLYLSMTVSCVIVQSNSKDADETAQVCFYLHYLLFTYKMSSVCIKISKTG